MAPQAEPAVPRRGRRLVPAGLPRRGELIAACAVGCVLVHLLFAQLTLVLVVVFTLVGRTTRWRLWWLLWPALAGALWTLAAGPDQALAGFAAGPASLLRHLGAGGAAAHSGHPLDALAGIGGWLPRQFPLSLPLAAAEAAVLGWLAWLRTDEWAVPAPRPGAVAALRAAVTTRFIGSGAVLTRDGCALGTVPATGGAAELRWAEIAHGVLVVGADEQQVTLASLQIVHAALRRRKPLIVLDDGRDGAVVAAVTAACRATGSPLRPVASGCDQAAAGRAAGGTGTGAGTSASASQLWGRANAGRAAASQPAGDAGPVRGDLGYADLTQIIGERSAVLLPVGSAELAERACASLTALAASLRRIGVDGDALVWAPHAERLPPQALGPLLRNGATAGLAVLAGTTSPAAAELAGQAGTILVGRVTDTSLAAALAARTGTRLLPPPAAAMLAGHQPAPGPDREAGPWEASRWETMPPAAGPVTGPASATASAPAAPSPAAGPLLAPGLVRCPVVPARVLLALRRDEFVLAVSAPWPRHVAPGRLVLARLPSPRVPSPRVPSRRVASPRMTDPGVAG
jgi:hypothetical protein